MTCSSNLRVGIDVEQLEGERVSVDYFDVLGVAPRIGRTFTPADADRPVVVISDALWRRRFGADRDVVGRTFVFGRPRQRLPYTIVGIMGPGFTGVLNPWRGTEYWVPIVRRAADDRANLPLGNLASLVDFLIGRLRPGVTIEQAQAYTTAWGRSKAPVIPMRLGPPLASPVVLTARRARLPFRAPGSITAGRLGAGLMMVTALVLVVGAVNLAGIVMARGVVRQSEVAVRLSLGASRWRLARQWTAEGALLALGGGLSGLAASRGLVKILLDNMPATIGRGTTSSQVVSLGVPLDLHVIVFAVLLSLAVGLVVGLAPMRQTWKTDVVNVLSGAPMVAPRRVLSRLRYGIVVPQVCCSLVLLLAAGATVRALLSIALVSPGYEPDHAAYVRFEFTPFPPAQWSDAQKAAYRARQTASYRRLLETVRTLPVVEAAGFGYSLPGGDFGTPAISSEDYTTGHSRMVRNPWVTPGYFRALGVPLVFGRAFDERDVASRASVVVIDRVLADQLWPGVNPIGRDLAFSQGARSIATGPSGEPAVPSPPVWLRVIGVVGEVKPPLSNGASNPSAYSLLPDDGLGTLARVLVARGRGSGTDLIAALHKAVEDAGGDFAVVEARTVRAEVDEQRYRRRLAAELLGFSSLAGLVLAGVGLYGVMSYSLAQRLKEMGIRAALGADRRDIAVLVLGEGLRVLAVGLTLGLPLAYIAVRTLSHRLVPIPPMGASTLVAVPIVLLAIVLGACWFPARRAARTDPMAVLRGL